MSSGLETTRDFVFGVVGQGNDWHGKTIETPDLSIKHFPEIEEVDLKYSYTNKDNVTVQLNSTEHVLISTDDGQQCGKAFNPDTKSYILPDRAWAMVSEALAGTNYQIERIGMLKDRSLWFVSICLEEFKQLAKQGERFQLNFSGALDGTFSPQGEVSHTRVVCQNTLNLSRATGENLFRIKQTKNSIARLNNAKAQVEQAVGMVKIFQMTMDSISSKGIKPETARNAYAGDIARTICKDGKTKLDNAFENTMTKKGSVRENRGLNQIGDLLSLFERGDGNKGQTRADLLNGYTQYFTRGGNDESNKSPWNAMASSEFGGNGTRKANFLNYVSNETEFAKLVADGKTALAGVNN